jgi:uncharacterized lipoprotein YbaY
MLRAAIVAILLTGCVTAPPTPAPVVTAPAPVAYTCDQMRSAGRELDALPVGAMLRVLVNDYGVLRRALRAARGEDEPAGCAAG